VRQSRRVGTAIRVGYVPPVGGGARIVPSAKIVPSASPSHARIANTTGFVLADVDFTVTYANQAAIRILRYSEGPREAAASGPAVVQQRIRSILGVERFAPGLPLNSFHSGRRRYVCRPFLLESGDRPPIVALVLDRRSRDSFDLSEISQRFHLSPRECETVRHLTHGLTTKEVAQRMNVSPNTIKQFVRLIMSKMGVTTRSGIIGMLISG